MDAKQNLNVEFQRHLAGTRMILEGRMQCADATAKVVRILVQENIYDCFTISWTKVARRFDLT